MNVKYFKALARLRKSDASDTGAAATLGLVSIGVEHGLHSAIPARSRISSIYCRREKKSITATLNMHTEEVMQFTKVFHGELPLEN
jgi:hypothetical protein